MSFPKNHCSYRPTLASILDLIVEEAEKYVVDAVEYAWENSRVALDFQSEQEETSIKI